MMRCFWLSRQAWACLAVEAAVRKLNMAGFVISPKSQRETVHSVKFVGKLFDAPSKSVSNYPGALAAALPIWLHRVQTGCIG